MILSMKSYAFRNFTTAVMRVALFSFTILTSSFAGSERASESLTEFSSELQSFVDSGETTGVVILARNEANLC
mgnify:CR=1 FL=1